MTESPTKEKNSSEFASFIVLATGVVLAGIIGYFLFSNLGTFRKFLRESDTYPLAISTNPDGATVILDERIVGKSPVTLLTFPGAHVVTVRKDGYHSQSHAFELSRDRYTSDKEWKQEIIKKGSPWSYNFKLEAVQENSGASLAAATPPNSSRIAGLETQIQDVRSLILSNPEQSLSYGLIKNRIDALEKEVGALREQAELSNTLSLALWATVVAVFLALFALLYNRRKAAP